MIHSSMKARIVYQGMVLLALATLLGGGARAQTSYTCIDLGNYVNAVSINNIGQVVGTTVGNSPLSPTGGRAFRITPLDTNSDGKPDTWFRDLNNDGINDLIVVLPAPAGVTSHAASSINASGAVAGFGNGPIYIGTNNVAESLPRDGTTNVYSMNDDNIIVGQDVNKTKWVATTWEKTTSKKGTTWTRTFLGAPSGYTYTRGFAINNAGAVAARTEAPSYVPALWLPSPMYGRPSGWSLLDGTGWPKSINNLGQMAGDSGTHAVLWLLQGAYDLPMGMNDLHPPGTPFTSSSANGLNQAPDGILSVVGGLGGTGLAGHAFVWTSDTKQMLDLNEVTSGIPVGVVLTTALAVNDSGVIVCRWSYTNPSGSRSFILVPQ